MGAAPFIIYQPVADLPSAFHQACEHARYECGHNGYTGTIAEKDRYEVVDAPRCTLAQAASLARRLMRAEDTRFNTKDGPAGAVAVYPATPAAAEPEPPEGWVFFGLARE